MKPFEPNKTAEELGIDKTRKFVVVKPFYPYNKIFFQAGEKITFVKDETADEPGAIFRGSNGRQAFMFWSDLAYAEEKEPEPYLPCVGDRVSLEGEIVQTDSLSVQVRFGEIGPGKIVEFTRFYEKGNIKLLSRKPPRKVTMEEVRGKFGEDMEIVGE